MEALQSSSSSVASLKALEVEACGVFQRCSVDEVRTRTAATREDIEHKKQELRRLVGTRYRDLIDSADSIIQMRDLSQQLFQRIRRIEDHCYTLTKRRNATQLQQSAEKENGPTISSQESEHRRKYMLGKRIKLLVDTPEEIWSALDENQHLHATQLYLQAEKVHHELGTSGEGSILVRKCAKSGISHFADFDSVAIETMGHCDSIPSEDPCPISRPFA